MRVPRVYADTSVFGGPFDEEFSEPSNAFFNAVSNGEFSLVTSALVRQELAPAPRQAQDLFAQFAAAAEIADVTEEALLLRNAYVDAGIVLETAMTDALHVALATVAACDLIVSWNFRHIVHFRKIPLYNAVNTLRGYGSIAIHSPQEVIKDENQDI